MKLNKLANKIIMKTVLIQGVPLKNNDKYKEK